MVLPDAPFVDEGIERLLHLGGAGVQLVQEQDVWLASGNSPGRAELAEAALDLRDADDILRGQLAAQEGDALQAQAVRKFLNDGRLSDARRAPDKHRTDKPHIEKDIQKLLLIDSDCQIHTVKILL